MCVCVVMRWDSTPFFLVGAREDLGNLNTETKRDADMIGAKLK